MARDGNKTEDEDMGFTLFALGAGVERGAYHAADNFDCHEIVAAQTRAGFEGQDLSHPHQQIVQYRFATEPEMLEGREEIARQAPTGTILIATEDFAQREQPEIPGGPTLFVPIKRRSDLDRPAFHKRWHSHGPLILELVPGLLGYVQHHMTPSTYTLDRSGYDGVARFWFKDIDAVTGMPSTHPAEFDRIVADENAFLAMPIENYIGQRPAT